MGSKRTMLQNGLGDVIGRNIRSAKGFADLFTGSGAVAWHVCERSQLPVRAFDLQAFAVALADGVIGRGAAMLETGWILDWLSAGTSLASSSEIGRQSIALETRYVHDKIADVVLEARQLSSESEHEFCRAYGGYYYSPWQATVLATLRSQLPSGSDERRLSLAALIATASSCAAAPGHTAQPFRPTSSAGPYLIEAWRKCPTEILSVKLRELGSRHALGDGTAQVSDAASAAETLSEGWVAFVDPPYSSVHYSRFYHVLESLARGTVGEVSGAGRYPSSSERPQSDFSVASRASSAFDRLFAAISCAGARAIVTFPDTGASNGITGATLRELAETYFRIDEVKISSRLSTMGGNTTHRSARVEAVELILSLSPK